MDRNLITYNLDLGSGIFGIIEREALQLAEKSLMTKDDFLGAALRDGVTFWYEGVNVALDPIGTPFVIRESSL